MQFQIERTRKILDDFFEVEEAYVRYERFDGTMTEPVRRLSFERGDAAAALLVDRRRQRVILTRQFRFPTCRRGPGWLLETAAGMVPEHESPEESMRREIEEEAGYAVSTLAPIATFYVSPGGSSERIFLYCAAVDERDRVDGGGGVAGESEDIQVVEIPIAELQGMLDRAEIMDAKTIIALQWLMARLPEWQEADNES